MSIRYAATLRGTRLDDVTAAVGSGGKLRIYDGVQPATGGAVTTLIAELSWAGAFATAASISSNGGDTLLVVNDPVTSNVTKLGTTTATWFRVVSSANVFVFDGSVGMGTGDLQLGTTSLSFGQPIDITSFIIHEGNP